MHPDWPQQPHRPRRRDTPAWFSCAPPGHLTDADQRAAERRAEAERIAALQARKRPPLPRDRAALIAELRRRQGVPSRPAVRDAISFGDPQRHSLTYDSPRARAEALAGEVPEIVAHVVDVGEEGATMAAACPYCLAVHEHVYVEVDLPRIERAPCGWGEYRVTR